MNRTQFIELLCAYGLLVLLCLLAKKCVRLPEHVERAKPEKLNILGGKSKLYYIFMLCAIGLVSSSNLVGFLGMFLFWKAAPWIFGFGIIGRFVFHPKAVWSVCSGWEDTFIGLETLLGGIIIALTLFGSARHLFFP
jgi:hypothetical protein